MSTTPSDPSDFSQRLSAALQRAKTPSSTAAAQTAAAAAAGNPTATAAATGGGQADAFGDRLAGALRRARGEPETPPAEVAEAEAAGDARPVGTGDHVVKPGECISSIAVKYGFHPETIWTDPENAELREKREDMNVLLPGDRLTIPAKTRRDEPLVVETRNRFKRNAIPEILRVIFQDEDGEPYDSEQYKIDIDGEQRDGTTDADGRVEEPIWPGALEAIITFPDRDEVYEFDLGHLEPIDSTKGVQARLKNLGFYNGKINGELDEGTVRAIRKYQSAHRLTRRDGELDQETRDHLHDRHQS